MQPVNYLCKDKIKQNEMQSYAFPLQKGIVSLFLFIFFSTARRIKTKQTRDTSINLNH